MAKYVTVPRKFLRYGALAVVVAFVGVMGGTVIFNATDPVLEAGGPEVKVTSMEFTPKLALKDVTYGEENFKGLPTMTEKSFQMSAVIQNTTEKTMADIPVQMTLKLSKDGGEEIKKEGRIPALEPGGTAKVVFENMEALGDSQGVSFLDGQHELVLRINANPTGNVLQNTETRVVFQVDTGNGS